MDESEEYLLMSGIQHFAFCPRQWALIHIEQQWAENVRTVEGQQLHEHTDDPFSDETRHDVKEIRAVPVISHRLSLRGVVDRLELYHDPSLMEGEGITLSDAPGRWRPFPVEYKRGLPKPDNRDAVQLCAQAMALEEMLGVTVGKGALYYWQTRHRETVVFDAALRQRTEELAYQMHNLFAAGKTPPAVREKHCALCSLENLCLPDLAARSRTVAGYLERMLSDG